MSCGFLSICIAANGTTDNLTMLQKTAEDADSHEALSANKANELGALGLAGADSRLPVSMTWLMIQDTFVRLRGLCKIVVLEYALDEVDLPPRCTPLLGGARPGIAVVIFE